MNTMPFFLPLCPLYMLYSLPGTRLPHPLLSGLAPSLIPSQLLLPWSKLPTPTSNPSTAQQPGWPFTVFSSVPSLSHVQFFGTQWTAARQASLSITNSQSLLRFMSVESVMPSNRLILSLPSPPTFNLSQHQCLFKCVSSSHQVAKLLAF